MVSLTVRARNDSRMLPTLLLLLGRALKHVKQSEYIREKTLDFIGRDGSLAPGINERIRKMVVRGHNHPCVAFWDSGNELRVRPAVVQYARAFYREVKKHDRQQRPVASFGSGPHLEDYSTKLAKGNQEQYQAPTDLLDYHVYSGSLHGTSWLDIPWTNRRWMQRFKLIAGPGKIPVINGETVGITLYGSAARVCFRNLVRWGIGE